METKGITKVNVIGWLITVALSVTAAYGTINARIYEVEKKIELLQMQITEDGKKIDQQASDMKEVREMFNRIDKNLIQLTGVVNLKKDKYEKIKQVIAFVLDLPRQWRAETPRAAKLVRNIAATISAVVPGAWFTLREMGILLPQWFESSVGYITLIALIITGISGTKEKKGETK